MDSLVTHFRSKFAPNQTSTYEMIEASHRVKSKQSSLSDVYKETGLDHKDIKTYVGDLNTDCAPGVDGITSEHIKFAMDTNIITHIHALLNTCMMFGVVPESFARGVL